MQSSILPIGHNYREQTLTFFDEERISSTQLIQILAPLFWPSLAGWLSEEEWLGENQ